MSLFLLASLEDLNKELSPRDQVRYSHFVSLVRRRFVPSHSLRHYA